MTRCLVRLTRIDHNETITKESHSAFLHHLQGALLLALREQGRLNAMQYRHAEEKLKQQRLERGKNILEKEEGQ